MKRLILLVLAVPLLLVAQTRIGSNQLPQAANFSKLNNARVVDGVVYSKIQAAITDACAQSPVAPVYIPSGTYTMNASLTLCSNLEIAGAGMNGPASSGGTLINTNIRSGNFFDIAGFSNVHIHDLRLHNTSSGVTTSQAIVLHWGQGVLVERVFADGNFQNGLVLNPVPGTASTITNEFRQLQIQASGSSGIGCLLDAKTSTDKVINGNTFDNVICLGTSVGFETTGGGGGGNTYINENTLIGLQPYASSGTCVQLNATSTSDLTLINPTIESCTTGISSVSGNTVYCISCEIAGNTSNISDPNGNIVFFRGRGPQLGSQQFSLDPSGNLKINGLGINAGPNPGGINLASGNTINVAGVSTVRWNSANVTLMGATSLTLGQTTVKALPSASANPGTILLVTDSTTVSAEGQTCAGGGSNKAVAISNGSTWKCF